MPSHIREHPDRNKLLRVLGISGDTPGFELSELQELKKFQAFLLCSDGFWEYILEKEMCALLSILIYVEVPVILLLSPATDHRPCFN